MRSGFDEGDRNDRSDEASLQDRQLKDVGRITGELLHDLGSILSLLCGRVALAREKATLGRIPSEELDRIQTDTDELRRMVLDILDEFRGVPSPLEATFPVTPTVEEAMNRWLLGAPSIGTRLRVEIPPEAQIAGPRSFFSRALGNLLRNAARHARSEIVVSLLPGREPHQIEIRVEDDGEGVAPEVRKHLFEPFVSKSTAGSGLGLGLSFARWGINRLGGSLELKEASDSLGGACFQMQLPLARSPVRRALDCSGALPSERGDSGGEPLAGLRVAVVDDNQGIRKLYARLLRRSGAEPDVFDPAGWKTAAHAARELGAVESDVILLDVNLDGLSGLTVEERLSRECPKLGERIVFMTGGPALEGIDRPVINKMATWDEVVAAIVAVADSAPDAG